MTLRNDTEWVDTVEAVWNVLAGVDREGIMSVRPSFMKVAPIIREMSGYAEEFDQLIKYEPVPDCH